MKGNIIALVTGTIFLIVGIVCLLWPESIQRFGVDYYIRHKTDEKLNPFLNWMKTRGYVWSIRFTGLIAIAGFVLLFIAFIKDLER
jgi:hypothetical protein